MNINHLSDSEIAKRLAEKFRLWRLSPQGAGMTQAELAARSGMGLTPLKRFEKTGGITLRNLVALMRAFGLLDRLDSLVPDPATPSPIEVLRAERAGEKTRQRAARTRAGEKKRLA